MTNLAHTVDEIATHMTTLDGQDFFGVQRAALVGSLPYRVAKDWLKPEVTAAEWDPNVSDTAEKVTAEAREYLAFAMGKAEDHRGLSANRSVDHYKGWLWLLGKDNRIDWERWGQYGVGVLWQVVTVMGWQDTWTEHTTPALGRMRDGLPCSPDCMEGCFA